MPGTWALVASATMLWHVNSFEGPSLSCEENRLETTQTVQGLRKFRLHVHGTLCCRESKAVWSLEAPTYWGDLSFHSRAENFLLVTARIRLLLLEAL